MTVRRRSGYDELSLPALPPPDAVVYDVSKEGLIPTPVDSRGLVDFKALVTVVDNTVVPEYVWPSEFNDIHHLQWPRAFYGYQFGETVDRIQFRNLAISQAILPRTFHNWIHAVTAPPDVPSEEVCEYRIETERVVKSLFQTALISAKLMRNKTISEKTLNERLMRNFEDFSRELESIRGLPYEFVPEGIEPANLSSIDDIIRIAPTLGRIASIPTVAVTTRKIRQTNRAA